MIAFLMAHENLMKAPVESSRVCSMMCWFCRARRPAAFGPPGRRAAYVPVFIPTPSLVVFQSPTLSAPWSGAPTFTSSSERWPWSFIIWRRSHSMSLLVSHSFCLGWTNLSTPAPASGDGFPGGPRVQGRPGRLPASPGEAVDHVSQSEAQLLRAR